MNVALTLGILVIFIGGVLAPSAAFELDDLLLSYWCGPDPSFDAAERYAEVAACHFNWCLPPCSGATLEHNLAALAACEKHGLKMIVADERILKRLPEDPQFEAELASVVRDYAASPALGGYFIMDEPGAAAFERLAAVHAKLLKLDPGRLPYINLFPDYASPEQLGTATYEEYVERFCRIVHPRLLSYDHYALMNDGSLRPSYFQNMEIIRDAALRHGIPFCFILQLIPHGPYRDPSEAELRWQVNTALAYGAKGILYFTYWTPGSDPVWEFQRAVITRDGERTAHYRQLQRLNRELRVIGPVLAKLTSVGVYHTGDLPPGTSAPDSRLPVKVSGGPTVVGLFRHQDGTGWLMLTNRMMDTPCRVTLRLSGKTAGLSEMSRISGGMIPVPLNDSSVDLELRAGEGRLFRLR
jgi:hypothetical protein